MSQKLLTSDGVLVGPSTSNHDQNTTDNEESMDLEPCTLGGDDFTDLLDQESGDDLFDHRLPKLNMRERAAAVSKIGNGVISLL